MAAKKRQTFGKMQRERERAEKRAQKQEKKDERKSIEQAKREAEALGIPYVGPEEEEPAVNWNSPDFAGVEDRSGSAT